MNQQPEALRLADLLEKAYHMNLAGPDLEAAEELRRLHAANIDCINHFNALMHERNNLLEALKQIADPRLATQEPINIARAAIAEATGESK